MVEKSIVITGAAGLIGSGVVRYLNDLEHENLILVDELNHPDKVKNLQGKKYRQLLAIPELFGWLQGRDGSSRGSLAAHVLSALASPSNRLTAPL